MIARVIRKGLMALILGFFLWATSIFSGLAAPRRVLAGHGTHHWTNLPPISHLGSSSKLGLTLGLPLRNTTVLTNLLRELYDPASPNFRHYLKPEEFAAQFSPTEADYQSMLEFAVTNHLRVNMKHSNRTLLNVEGSVADIEKAFGLNLRVYRHPHEARDFYAPDAEPSLAADAPAMASIGGLDNFTIPHPMNAHLIQPNGLTPRAGSGVSGSFLGTDFRSAYVPGTALNGAGQSIALFEADGYYTADIAAYVAAAGLPGVTLSNILVDGYSGAAGANNMEVALDIEMAMAMAPNLSSVLVYEGANQNNITTPNDILNKIATDNLAKQIGCSWGFSINTNTEQIFLQFAAQGQSFFLASGDNGAFNGSVPQPSDDPFITVVGGTALTMSNGVYQSERVWNWNNDGTGTNASGGGISTTYPLPSWQQGVSMANNQGSTANRNTPDVALAADNIEVIYNNGTRGVLAGTSASAPLWAGFAALANQQAAANGQPPLGFLNPALYSLGKGANYAATFHDITAGNNTNAASPTRFFARQGYDLCTGWGTPAGTNLINLLAPPPNIPVLTGSLSLASESALPANGVIDPYETVSLNLILKNVGGAATSNLVAAVLTNSGAVLAGAPVSFGSLPGGGASATLPIVFSALGECGGSITVSVQLTDCSANLGVLSMNFTLGQPVEFTNMTQNFDGTVASAFPPGWATSNTNTQNWAVSTAAKDTAPNSAYCADSIREGASWLYSPIMAISSANAQLTFRQNYYFEYHAAAYYDGGVLEISVDGGNFVDILAAGGSFVVGGYNTNIIAAATANPLAGRRCWSGRSGVFITTTAILPPSAAGKNIQFRWGVGTDSGNSFTTGGWYVDSVAVMDSRYGCAVPNASLVLTQSLAPALLMPGQTGTYTLSVSNSGPCLAAGVTLTDTLPANTTVTAIPSGCLMGSGQISVNLGTLPLGAVSNLVFSITANGTNALTNVFSATAFTPGTTASNTLVSQPAIAPYILNQPTNISVGCNGTAMFTVQAGGSSPLRFQWLRNSNLLTGINSAQLNFISTQASNAGWYQVVITNACGAVTSTVASLSVLGLPVSFDANAGALRCSNGVLTVPVRGLTGQGPVVIECSADMINWSPIYTNSAGFGNFVFKDTNAGRLGSKFYRAHTPASP